MKLDLTESIKSSLKQVNDIEDEVKLTGLNSVQEILEEADPKVKSHGYDQVILKELIRVLQFEHGEVLDKALRIVLGHFFLKEDNQDEILETLIYRVARSTDVAICRTCLNGIMLALDNVGDLIAKHSKQLMRLAELNDMADVNPLIIQILEKMRDKLPRRLSIYQQ